MTGVTELDRIFYTASVCRSFRLNGLQEILKRVKLNIKPVTLIWQVGDLSARGYFDTSVVNFVVDPGKAKEMLEEKPLQSPTPLQLHQEWRDWYSQEFKKYLKEDDLAELLFHEVASVEDIPEGQSKLEYLKSKTVEYLWMYYDEMIERYTLEFQKSSEIKQTHILPQAFADLASGLTKKGEDEKAQEVKKYISILGHYIQDEDLNRFRGEVLSEEDYHTFKAFLETLYP